MPWYPTSYHKGFFETVGQVQWGGGILIVLPAELSRSLQNTQMPIEHNPASPPKKFPEKFVFIGSLRWQEVVLTPVTGDVKGDVTQYCKM